LRRRRRWQDVMSSSDFDCIVVGGGHAGTEAAFASARMGAATALITISRETIGQMSCNPAIGGLAKGQIVREVDALGGLMGLAIDATGIQFRLLNRSKGPAVRSPRAQADRHRYQRFMRERLEAAENLTIVQALATGIEAQAGKVRAVRCADGSVYRGRTVVVTAGTFLGGVMYMGSDKWAGGRIGEPASVELSASLRRLGLEQGRMATDTTPRLDASTVDVDRLEVQRGDEPPIPFSFLTGRIERRQMPCWITYTNERIHKLLRDNLHRAPLSSGQIRGTDPRYCPSIESKVIRFADKKQHRVFLEPEEESVETIYCNGIFTSMPKDVQEQVLALLPGTESARILRHAYAIEYDYFPAYQLDRNLETRCVEGLFLAGQVNGTSGYEEAAGQGIVAGINAARKASGGEPVVLGRDEAYIGVLIDDLLTKRIDEPYRMFTSRAEYRLSLRSDNADRRLTPIGRTVGLVDEVRWRKYKQKAAGIERLEGYLRRQRRGGMSLWQRLRAGGIDAERLLSAEPGISGDGFTPEQIEAVAIDAKYEGYLAKQERVTASLRKLEGKRLPADVDYSRIVHLRREAREKLSAFRPATLGQASRISGVTPADITVLQVYLRKYG